MRSALVDRLLWAVSAKCRICASKLAKAAKLGYSGIAPT
jgi:hypothetical protein